MTAWPSVVDALADLGVRRVFGVPGTQTVEAFEALRRRGIPVTLPTNELSASFMAGAYHRATGEVGVLFTIGGPGFTYTLPGLAEARLDSVGILHVMNAPATSPGTRFQLQAIDQSTIGRPLTKGDFGLGPDDDAGEIVGAAYRLAGAGEPGPVMLQVGRASEGVIVGPEPATVPSDPEEALTRLQALYAGARRPLLLLGQGAVGEAERLRRIVDDRRVPVVTTPSGRGIVGEDHPMVVGFDALRGRVGVVNELVDRSDLVVVLGAKLGHNGTAGFGLRLPQDRLVHVDRAPHVPGANYPTLLTVASDVSGAVDRMEEAGVSRRATEWDGGEIASFRSRIGGDADSGPEPVIRGAGDLTPAAFFQWLRRVLPDRATLVTDTGLHQIMTRRYFEVRAPRGLVIPSDFQSMGFGLPSAIGFRLASPDRPVAALIGDGGFLISAMELVTAVRDGIPLLLIVFRDGALNQIRLQQMKESGRPHAVSVGHVDYGAFARSIGARHALFGEHDDDQLRAALVDPPPLLLEVTVDDSWGIRAMGAERRVKTGIRDFVGPELTEWIKGRVRR